MNPLHLPDGVTSKEIRRRTLLQGIGAGTLLAGAGSLLSACSPAQNKTTSATGAAGEPQRGGTLRIGASGGAATDTLDAHNPLTNTDFARLAQLYDPLLRLDHEGKFQMVLAEEIEPDSKGQVWTIRIRDGVRTHDGAALEAADVLYSFKRITDNKLAGAAYLVPIDFAASKVLDKRTVQLAFTRPNAIFKQVIAHHAQFNIVPRGYDPAHPVGTGPFKLKSFKPGVESTMVRFDDYWDADKPYLDSIVTLNMADETTQVNALQSGQVDAINYMSAQSVRQLQNNGAVVTISETGGWAPITMRVDKAPFDDVRVRQALRLLVDRQQMLDIVFGGHGSIGNDVFGVVDPLSGFDKVRQRDAEQAKSLLKAAGRSDLHLTLLTNDVVPFQKSVAQLFAQQAKDAGVSVNVAQKTATDFFATDYLKAPFAQDYWFNLPYLGNVAGATAATAPYNATHFNDTEYEKLFQQAVATPDENLQRQIVTDMQNIDFERGGNIIPFFYPQIDATTTKVGGIAKDVSGFPFGNYDFKNIWLSS